VVHSLRDITRVKQADEAKTMFLATASHELKTPLTVIQGFAHLLQADGWDADARRRALEAVESRAIQLTGIVDRILLSSRIEAGRAEVTPSDLDVVPLLRERVDAVRATTRREVVLRVSDGVAHAIADTNALVTVIDHLLDNAIKYSPAGGGVVVTAAADERRVRISVADEGIGMDDEQAAKCFDKFWQAETGDVRRFGGTGIGLYIVKSLVEAMRGDLAVASAPAQGTTFCVSLPRAGSPAAVGAHSARGGPGVGDPSIVREFMRQLGIPQRRQP
jgi:signal transduction histidine kinase